jgi:hypothetical protein
MELNNKQLMSDIHVLIGSFIEYQKKKDYGTLRQAILILECVLEDFSTDYNDTARITSPYLYDVVFDVSVNSLCEWHNTILDIISNYCDIDIMW